MAALVLIIISVGVDLYNVGVRCFESGFTFSNIVQVLRELHDDLRATKYIECIDEFYENTVNSDTHSIGIDCLNCRRKINRMKMICNEIENAIGVDGADEAFEILSYDVSKM